MASVTIHMEPFKMEASALEKKESALNYTVTPQFIDEFKPKLYFMVRAADEEGEGTKINLDADAGELKKILGATVFNLKGGKKKKTMKRYKKGKK